MEVICDFQVFVSPNLGSKLPSESMSNHVSTKGLQQIHDFGGPATPGLGPVVHIGTLHLPV